MRLLIDVCLARWIASLLAERGHACLWMTEVSHKASDEEIASEGALRRAVVVTHDYDFGDLLVRQRLSTHGALIIDMSSFQDSDAAMRLSELMEAHEANLEGALTIFRRRRVRQRFLAGYIRPIA